MFIPFHTGLAQLGSSGRKGTFRGAGLTLLLTLVAATASQARDIRGTVQDRSYASIGGAFVTLVQEKSEQTATTTSDGAFSFSNLDQRPARLRVQAPHLAAVQRNIAAGSNNILMTVVLQPETVNTQMVVTASRSSLPLSESPAAVDVLTESQIASTPALSVDDVLRQRAGFDLFRRSSSRTANPTTQGVSLRGLGSSGASRALVLLDGVPVTDPFGGWMNWSQFPRAAIDSVEMLRGGASDLYGGEALSGVVQLFTRTPQSTDANIDLSYGNEAAPNASGYLGQRLGQWLLSGAGEYFRTDGYIPVGKPERGPVDTLANSLHRNGELQVQRVLSQRSRIFLRGLGYDDSRHNGKPLETNRTRAWHAVAGADWELARGDLFQLRGYGGSETFYQTFVAVSPDRTTGTLTRVQSVPSRQWGGSAQYAGPLTRRHFLVAGVDFSSVTGESDEQLFTAAKPSSLVDAGGRDLTFGFFVQDIAHLTSRWVVTAAIRFDRWQTTNGFSNSKVLGTGKNSSATFPDRSEGAVDPRVASSYQINDHVGLQASIYRAFRSPTLNELYRSFRLGNILTLANQQLRAERLTGWEAGPNEKLFNGKLRLQQNFFWADVRRPISNVTQSTTSTLITRMRENLGSTRARGIELQAEWIVTTGMELGAQYQYVDATVISFPANRSLQGLRVPEVPRHEFTFQASYSNPRYATLSLQARSSGSQFDDDQNLFPLDSFFKLDAFASRRLTPAVDIYVAGENLLNQRYQVARTPVTMLGSPILFRIGMQIHLGHS